MVHYVPKEFSSNIYSFNGLFFETRAEMFQLVERPGLFGIKYAGAFLDHLNTSSLFRGTNPVFMPSVRGSNRVYSDPIKIGKYVVGGEWFVRIDRKRKLDLVDDEWYQKREGVPNLEVNHLNTQVFDNALYTGDPLNPVVGDLRVTFYGSEDASFSVIGRQTRALLSKEYEIKPVEFQGRSVVLVSGGSMDKVQLQEFYFSQMHEGRSQGLEAALFVLLTLLYLSVNLEMGRACKLTCSACMAGITVNLTEVVILSFYNFKLALKPVFWGGAFGLGVAMACKIDGAAFGIKGAKGDLGGNLDSAVWSAESRATSLETDALM